MKIGIIGFGQMGQFISTHLKRFGDVAVFDIIDRTKEAKTLGVRLTNIEEVCDVELLFLFVPISKIQDCCELIKGHTKKSTLIVECCSVMDKPLALISQVFPNVIGCHPLFGPQSGKKGIKGFTIVLNKDNPALEKIFKNMKLRILIMSSKKHDRLMAKTQALEQFIGKLLVLMNVKNELISTPGFNLLIKLRNMLEQDSDDLFNNIQTQNDFAFEIRKQFVNQVHTLEETLQ